LVIPNSCLYQFFSFLNRFDSDKSDSGDENESREDQTIGTRINEDEIELKDEDVKKLSNEDDDNQYTSHSCKQSLAKVKCYHPFLN
jgi:hypothetical protein